MSHATEASLRRLVLPILILIGLVSPPVRLLAAAQPVKKPELVLQTGHTLALSSIAYSADGRWLVSGAWDGSVKLWDSDAAVEIGSFLGHSGVVTAVAFSPDEKFVASASQDGTVRVWDVAAGTEKFRFKGPGSLRDEIAFSRDNSWIAVGSRTVLGITLWNLASGKELRKFEGREFVFSPDDTLVAFSTRVAFSTDQSDVVIAAVSTGRELSRLPSDRPISFRSDGGEVASIDANGEIELWDVQSGPPSKVKFLFGAFRPAGRELLLSPDWQYLATGGTGDVSLWSVKTGQKLWTQKTNGNSGIGLHVTSTLAFQPGSHILASGSLDNSISYWDVESGRLSRRSQQEAERLVEVAISSDAHWMATFSVDQTAVIVWDLKGDSGIKRFSGPGGRLIWSPAETKPRGNARMAFSADNRSIALGRLNTVVIWDLVTGHEIHEFAGHTGTINSVVFSADGRWMATGSGDNTARIWDLDSTREYGTIRPHSSRGVEVIGFTGSSRQLVIRDVGNRKIEFWNLANGDALTTHTSDDIGEVDSAVLTQDGHRLVTADETKHVVSVQDMTTGKQLKLGASQLPVALSRDGRIIALSREGAGSVDICEAATGKLLRRIRVSSDLTSTSFSPDGRLLAATSARGFTVLYERTTGKELLTLGASWNTDDWAAVASDGLFDGSSEGIRSLLVWKFGNGLADSAPIEIFLNEFYAPGLLSEVFGGARPRATRTIETIDRRQPTIHIDADKPVIQSGVDRSVLVSVTVNEVMPDAQHGKGTGVRDVRLFRDGSLVRIWRGNVPLDERGQTTLTATVSLSAAKARLSAYAFSHENIKSRDATFDISAGQTPTTPGVAYIVAVGIDSYANPEFDLKYAVADAEDVAKTLHTAQESLSQFGRVEVTRLLNGDATKANILRVLDRLAGSVSERDKVGSDERGRHLHQAKPGDAIFFYFAGHGVADGPRYYLIPHDLGYSGPRQTLTSTGFNKMLSHGISDRELESAFEKLDAGMIVFILDACDSGQALSGKDNRHGPMNSSGLAQLAYEKGMYILTAAQSYQAAIETAHFGHGDLTYALMEEGIKRGAADVSPKDGRVDLKEWLTYPIARVPALQVSNTSLQQRLLEHPKASSDNSVASRTADSIQQPRVFYRREASSADTLVVAQVAQRPSETSVAPPRTPAELFKEVDEARANFKSFYEVEEGTGTMTTAGRPTSHRKGTTRGGFAANGKFRADETSDDPDFPIDRTTASDGKFTWIYYGKGSKTNRNTFSKEAIVPATTFNPQASLASMVARESNLHIVREDNIELDGQAVQCYVVEGTQGSTTQTWWIDKTRKLVLRTDNSINTPNVKSEGSRVVKSVRINETLDDSLFTFTPPVDAIEVPPSTFRPRLVLSGRIAPSFKAKDQEDKEIDSTTLRGKVMLLTFWASWCLPCQEQLTTLERVFGQITNRNDLVAFGVNEEPAAVAGRYLGEKRLSVPVLFDPGGAIRRLFGVPSIPVTVIIDRQGKFLARLSGVQSESDVRKALKDAGIE